MQEIINAIEARNEELAIRLIRESGLNFSTVYDPDGAPLPTPVHYAAKQGLSNVIRCLLDHGADFDANAKWYYPDISEPSTYYETPSRWAIYYNQLEALKELWQNGLPKSIESDKHEKAYLLTKAAGQGHLEIVKWLIEEKGFPIDGVYEDRPIGYAFFKGHNHVVEYLLNKGASTTYRSSPKMHILNMDGFMDFLRQLLIQGFKFSNKSLIAVIDHCKIEEEIKLLVEQGYDLTKVDHEGISLIQAAVLDENIEMVEALLECAIFYNQLEALKELWQNGLPESIERIESDEYEKVNLLSKAAGQGHLEIVKWLIEEKGFPIDELEGSDIPIEDAFSSGHNHVVEYLLNKGASITRELCQVPSIVGEDMFMDFLRQLLIQEGFKFSNKSLVAALGYCDIEKEIKLLVEQGYALNRVDHEGISLIQAAVLDENIEIVEALLECAIFYNQLETLKELWQNGLPEKIESDKYEKAYLLSTAADQGHLEIVKWLIEEKGFPIDGDDECRPIEDAFSSGHNHVVEYLLNKGASITRKLWNVSSTLGEERFMDFFRQFLIRNDGFKFSNKSLIAVIDHCKIEEEIKLLAEQGYDLNRVDPEGISLIQAAVLKENIEAVETLLDMVVDINNVDPLGYNVLDYALFSQNEAIINLFHEKGFNILERQIQGNKYGLWAVIQGDSEYIAEAIMRGREQAIHTMQEKGLNLNCRTGELLKSPMHYAAYKNYANAIQLLIQFGADANIMDDNHQTPLYAAVRNGYTNIVNILIDNGKALTSLPNKLLSTAIHSQPKKLEIAVKLLNSEVYIDNSAFLAMRGANLVSQICEHAFKYDLSQVIGALMHISTACFKLDVREGVKANVRSQLHECYLKHGYDKFAKELEKVVKNKNSQTKDSLEKHKEAIKLFASIKEFESIADRLGKEGKMKLKQDLKASKDIVCDMPFSNLQGQIHPQQPLLNLISSFIPPKEQIVFTEIRKHASIFPQLQNSNYEFQPEPKVQKTGEGENAPMVDDIP